MREPDRVGETYPAGVPFRLIVALSTTIMHLKVFGFGATHLYTGKINAFKFGPRVIFLLHKFTLYHSALHQTLFILEEIRLKTAVAVMLGVSSWANLSSVMQHMSVCNY